MYSIYLFNNKEKCNRGINASDFEANFLHICENHRSHNKALVFAFILTDFRTMEANDLITNNVFWNNLHTLSGNFMTVFHFDFKSSDINKLFRADKTEHVIEQYQSFFSSLAKTFETEEFNNMKMPSILFFQTEGAEILDFFCIELESNKVQENMNDLMDYMEKAIESVRNVTRDNFRNSREIYNLLKGSIDATKFKKIWTKRLKRTIRLYELIK